MWKRKAPDKPKEVPTSIPDSLSEDFLVGSFPGWKVGEITIKYISEEMPQAWEVREMQEHLTKLYGLTARVSSIDLLNAKSWTDPKAKFRLTITLR